MGGCHEYSVGHAEAGSASTTRCVHLACAPGHPALTFAALGSGFRLLLLLLGGTRRGALQPGSGADTSRRQVEPCSKA